MYSSDGGDGGEAGTGGAGATEPQVAEGPTIRPGERVGRYLVLGKAGQGGMSVVLLAYDPELDRKVALKLLKVGRLSTKGKQRLLREAQALARLSHPNVVPVYDAGTVGELAFVAMEYVEGTTLEGWLAQRKRTWREILAVMREAGRGLAAAHAAGLVHRDVKPTNVLVGNDGRVRVVDFGLARSAETLSSPSPSPVAQELDENGAPLYTFLDSDGVESTSEPGRRALSQVTLADHVVGTPGYMSPEQANNLPVDARADQYSFGVTLYVALYGAMPGGESKTATVLERPGGGGLTPSVPADADVPRWVGRVVSRALAAKPDDRFASMDALLAALARDPAIRRRRVAMALAGIVAVAALVVVGARGAQRTQALCRAGDERVAAVWSRDAADELRRVFAASGVGFASASVEALIASLDGHAAAWAAQYRDACEAHHVRREQSAEALDLRMSCLGDELEELRALVGVLRLGGGDVVRGAGNAAKALTPVESCADVAALRRAEERPRDPAQRARVDALEARLARVQAHYAVGRSAEALKLGDLLLPEARQAGWGPLVAETLLWMGRAASDASDTKRAFAAFEEAFSSGIAARTDRIAAEAAVRLAQEHLFDTARADHDEQYALWKRIAEAVVRREGGDPQMALMIRRVDCTSLFDAGKLAERARCMEAVVAETTRTGRGEHWDYVTLGVAQIDVGQVEAGIAAIRRGVELAKGALGATHPRTLSDRGFLCHGLSERGDFAAADAECAEALAVAEREAADVPDVIDRLRLYRTRTLRELGRLDEAAALVARVRKSEDPWTVADATLAAALVEMARGRGAAAVALAEEAFAAHGKQLSGFHAVLAEDRAMIAEAQRRAGNRAAALASVRQAVSDGMKVETSPFVLAEAKLLLAELIVETRGEVGEAKRLAGEARATFERLAPTTPRWAKARPRVEAIERL